MSWVNPQGPYPWSPWRPWNPPYSPPPPANPVIQPPIVYPQRTELVKCKACFGLGTRLGEVCSGCKGAGVHRV